MAETAIFKYRAFLSYSHGDRRWARWLHHALEGYPIDKDLIGRTGTAGPVPKALRPIFRDREDFSGGHILTNATVQALDASAALIVLCSLASAERPLVNEEVRLFRSRHPERPVIPVIIDGNWPSNFPPALRYELASDGTITDQPITLLGPDLRESGDGRKLGLAKVIAGLIGVSTDDVFRRAERSRRRRNRMRASLAGVFLILAVGASAGALYWWHRYKTDDAFSSAAFRTIGESVNDVVTQAENLNVPRAATLTALSGIDRWLNDLVMPYGRPTPELRSSKAWMLIQFARSYAVLGNSAARRTCAEEAQSIMQNLANNNPENLAFQHDLSVAYEELGDALIALGNYVEGRANHLEAIAITERLAAANLGNFAAQYLLARSEDRIGQGWQEQGNLDEALKHHRASFTILKRLAAVEWKDSTTSSTLQGDLSVSYLHIGTILARQGNHADALSNYEMALAVNRKLASANPRRAIFLSELSTLHEAIGGVLYAQGQQAEAVDSFRASLAIRERLAAADPDNVRWQFNLVLSNWNLAAIGDDPAARRAFVVTTMRKLRDGNKLGESEIR